MNLRTIDGKYELLRELGRGGMGAVYEARNRHTGARVALKMVSADLLSHAGSAHYASRFRLEQLVGGSIVSQHVARVLDAGIDQASNRAYLVMELLRGLDLRQLLRRDGSLSETLVLKIASQACLGLQRVHAQHIVHRDIKTANLFVAEAEAGELVVKVLDFGIAKLREGAAHIPDVLPETKSQTLLGSPLYMSPEQAVSSRALDARSDLWSLGVVMYEALTGETPNRPLPLGALVLRICSQPPQPIRERRPDVSPEVAAVVHRALAIEPEQRFQSAGELHRALAALLPNGHTIRRSELTLNQGTEPLLGEQAAFDPTKLEPHAAEISRLRQQTMPTAPTTPTRRLDTPIEVVSVPASSTGSGSSRRISKSMLQLGAGVAAVFGLVANTGESAQLRDNLAPSVTFTEHDSLQTVTKQLENEATVLELALDAEQLICKKSDELSVARQPTNVVQADSPLPRVTVGYMEPRRRPPTARVPGRRIDKVAPAGPPSPVNPIAEPAVPLIVF